MHDTLHPKVKAHIDTNLQTIEGWCFHEDQGILPLRVISKTPVVTEEQQRPDVCTFYNHNLLNCGWKITSENSTEMIIQMNIDGEWITILEINKRPIIEFSDNSPSFIVVDNFYKNPDIIREFALMQTFIENPEYHKGKRAIDSSFRFPELKTQFEKILGRSIRNWDEYPVNGCFQYCTAEDKSVYHVDIQSYAGIIYLTPDSPPNAGTSFYRSKTTKKMKPDNDENIVFKTGFYDSTQFDLVDTVGNVYNRLILFDSKMIHAAPVYFGNNIENGRLFQLFFFDI